MRDIQNDHISTHVIALLLGYCRDLPRLIRRQIAREWAEWDQVQVLDPAEMTVLVLGLGGIGSEVTRRLAPFGPTHAVAPAFDPAVLSGVKEWFERHYSVRFANYPVTDDYLPHGVVVNPGAGLSAD